MSRDSSQTGKTAWRRLLAATLVVVPIVWGLSESDSDRTARSESTAVSSVFVPGQGPSAAPDNAMLVASDVERALPPAARARGFGFESHQS